MVSQKATVYNPHSSLCEKFSLELADCTGRPTLRTRSSFYHHIFNKYYFCVESIKKSSYHEGSYLVVCWTYVVFYPAGRMALLVTLFLVLVNIFNSVTGQAPKSEGLTAVETWVVMCILHVFCVLLEYAVILKIIQNEKRRIVAFRRAMAQQQYYAMAQIQGTNPPGQY